MPFQIANREAVKANHRRTKLFRDALLVAIKEADAEGVEALYHVAKALVAEAKAGNVLAIKEIGDRLDGRVPQALPGELGGEYEEPVIDEERMMRALALLVAEMQLSSGRSSTSPGNRKLAPSRDGADAGARISTGAIR